MMQTGLTGGWHRLFGLIFLFVLHAIALMLVCRSRYSRRITGWFCAGEMAAQFIFTILILITSIPYPAKTALAFIVTLGIFVANFLFLSRDSLPVNLFALFTYALAFMVVLYLAGMLSFWFVGGSEVIALWIRTLLHALLLVFYGVCLRERFDVLRQEDISGSWWWICLLSFMFMGYVSYIGVRAQGRMFRQMDVIHFLFLIIMVLVGYVVIFHTIYYMRRNARNRQIEMQQEIVFEKMEIMQQLQEETKRIRHDIRHHIMNISEYARNGENKALLRYLGEYSREIDKTEFPCISTDPAIDNVLSVYAKRAAQHGIRTDFQVSAGQDTGVREVDMVALLANLMENAIHGCMDSGREDMFLKVQMKKRAGKLSILVRNTCDEGMSIADRPPAAGIGLSSIRRSVSRYDGDMDVRSSQGVFESRIILNVERNHPS